MSHYPEAPLRSLLIRASLLALVVTVAPRPMTVETVEIPEVVQATVDVEVAEAGLSTSSGGSGATSRRSDPVAAPHPFTMIGFELPEGVDELLVRARSPEGVWSEWYEVDRVEPDDRPDPGTAEAAADRSHQFTDVAWVGESVQFQIQLPRGAQGAARLRARVLDTEGLAGGPVTSHRFTVPGPVAEAASRPSIVSRAQWGAQAPRSSATYASRVDITVVHHTAGSNSYTRAQAPGRVRGYQDYHRNVLGWKDIGYNALVDRYGTIYEGREGGIDRGVVGAHAANYNTGSFGVTVMGNFSSVDAPQAAYDALVRIISWKASLHGFDPMGTTGRTYNGNRLRTISGHRDMGQTACPGVIQNRMGWIRERSAAAAAPAPAPAPAPTPSASTSWPNDASNPTSAGGSRLGGSWTPVTGDWNGDGRRTPGWYRDGAWRLWGVGSSGEASVSFNYGRSGDVPVVGDWNGNGRESVGIVRDDRWHLSDQLAGGSANHTFSYGRLTRGDVAVTGDWNGSGRHGVGIIRDGTWHLRNTLSGGAGQIVFTYGRITRGDVPLVGDWNGDGRDGIGIVRNGTWHLRNTLSGGAGQIVFTYGRVTKGDFPLLGDWNRDGRSGIGIVRDGDWHLRNSLSGGGAQIQFTYR
jgi:hypothetical protein